VSVFRQIKRTTYQSGVNDCDERNILLLGTLYIKHRTQKKFLTFYDLGERIRLVLFGPIQNHYHIYLHGNRRQLNLFYRGF